MSLNSGVPSRRSNDAAMPDHLDQRGRQIPRRRQEAVELAGHAHLLALAELGDHVLLRGEVEEERAVRDTGRLRRSPSTSAATTPVALELRDRGGEEPLAGREPLRLPGRDLLARRHVEERNPCH